jgi:hypothetical protein
MPLSTPSHSQPPDHGHPHGRGKQASVSFTPMRSVLAWPAWLRVAAVLPVVLALWLAVLWANDGAPLW